MLHELLKIWFHWVEAWGYLGVFLLMAMESSIIPVPSEIVMPPAAFWAAQGRMSFAGVVIAGTLGSYAGSVASYYGAQWLGLPLLKRYGKLFLLSEDKIRAGENWVKNYGVSGIFIARLLPVVRHLISMPAGVFKMNFFSFSAATLLGSAIWCWILAWFGREVIGGQPELLQSPDAMVLAIKSKLQWFVIAAVLFGALYVVMTMLKRRSRE